MASRIQEPEWFVCLTGNYEDSFAIARDKHIVQVGVSRPPGACCDVYELGLLNVRTRQMYKAGTFYAASVNDLKMAALRNAEKMAVTTTAAEKCVLEIMTRDDFYSTRCVDVAALQADRDNDGAMFQAASNFNGVEAVSESYTPDSQNFTTNYTRDRTQGPAASVSAGAAAITRVHAAFYDPARPPAEWGQTVTRQIQLLESVTPQYF
jgi:hypothetical protein